MYLPMLNDRELLAHFEASRDALTTTDLEAEIAKRFETALDDRDALEPLVALDDEFDLDADALRAALESHPASLSDVAALLALLNDADIHTPDQLKACLALADQFDEIASDAGDVLARLHQLITTAQEK